jgi:uncharacterized membrane protein YdcZ (DUF606 family)
MRSYYLAGGVVGIIALAIGALVMRNLGRWTDVWFIGPWIACLVGTGRYLWVWWSRRQEA